jgi:hypothetical protein
MKSFGYIPIVMQKMQKQECRYDDEHPDNPPAPTLLIGSGYHQRQASGSHCELGAVSGGRGQLIRRDLSGFIALLT